MEMIPVISNVIRAVDFDQSTSRLKITLEQVISFASEEC